MELQTIIIRFGIVFVLSFLFGIERQRSHKPTGFATYILVSLGSCGLSLVALTIGMENPLPLLSAIVSGIGFLGAGALIKTTDKIYGFTTAASIWVFAIFGLIIGVGQYIEGIVLYALICGVILVDAYLERRGIGSYRMRLILTTNKILNTKEIDKVLPKNKLLLVDINKKDKKMILTYLVEGSKDEVNTIPKILYNQEWFESCKLE